MKKYNEQFLENGINICRSRNIEILGPIYYDKSNIIKGDYDCGQQFSVDKFFDIYSRNIISQNKI